MLAGQVGRVREHCVRRLREEQGAHHAADVWAALQQQDPRYHPAQPGGNDE